MITVYTNPLRDDATTIVIFRGQVNAVIEWSVESGPGEIEAISGNTTDERGLAMGIYKPLGGGAATAVLRVTYGT